MKCALHLAAWPTLLGLLAPKAVTISGGWATCEDCARHIKPWLSASANEAAALERVTRLSRGES